MSSEPSVATTAGPQLQRPIVVGVDGSVASLNALRWALSQAIATRAGLRLVVAWEPFGQKGWWGASLADSGRELEHRLALKAVVARAQPSMSRVPSEHLLIRGPAVPVLLGASQEASLLVLGETGQGGFTGLRLGSVSLHCVMYAYCPVVVVRGSVSPDPSDPLSATGNKPAPDAAPVAPR